MLSPSGRYVMVFNGEIYNHLDIRKELARTDWRGHADTETLLASFETFGIDATLSRSIGMFAFALWDRKERSLILGRDRIGEKPLYYGWQRGTLMFASELKALRKHPAFVGKVNRAAIASFLRLSYVPAPLSIYDDIRKLPAGSTVRFCEVPGNRLANWPDPIPYWSLYDESLNGQARQLADPSEAVAAFDALLRDAVAKQMLSDVPLGAFLSGGIDSSTIVAMMQAQSSQPVKTFTIGFREPRYNEAEHAKAVAGHLGTQHTEMYVSPDEARDVIPLLPSIYDEPFADASQVPTFLVARLARQSVTVALSGDAGDEMFGGYNRYTWANQFWRKFVRWAPAAVRRAVAVGAQSVPVQRWDNAVAAASAVLPRWMSGSRAGDKIHKSAEILTSQSPEEIYYRLISHWKNPAQLVVGASEQLTLHSDPGRWPRLPEFEHRMMYLDAMTYLPDDILVKVDRAAMGVSLETRVPFLDHRVVEFAWRLPLAFKMRDGTSKWILRQVLARYVPRSLIERPKMGFGVPIDSWLRGPLRAWADALLDEARLEREGFFRPNPIREKWRQHLSGERNWQYYLWDVLMFQSWLEHQSQA